MLQPSTPAQSHVPSESSQYAGWQDRLDTLALRANVTDIPVFIWQTTEQDFCRIQNSVVGLGPTRRLVLADQIFSEWDSGQIEVAFAHELKHYLLDNTWVPVVLVLILSFSGALFVFAIGTWACRRWRVRLRFDSLAQPAALPLLVALVQIYLLVAVPAFNLTA
jgi:STE24 endopeptidase